MAEEISDLRAKISDLLSELDSDGLVRACDECIPLSLNTIKDPSELEKIIVGIEAIIKDSEIEVIFEEEEDIKWGPI